MIGRIVSHYRILDKLGEGGMGLVYKAHDLHLERAVAMKILPADKVADGERKRRFIQEAKAASALNHPHIITIHDISSDGGIDFIVMEYLPGRTLDEATPRRGLSVVEALRYAAQIADAMSAAHAAGIIHRDLKPSNVMVLEDGRVKVLDFGLAKLTEPEAAGENESTRTLGAAAPLTEEGKIVGTVAYMSPEQAEGKKLDFRSDVFSFGSLLYEMLSGRRAFQRETKVATLSAILKEEPKPLGELAPEVPREVENLVQRCLRKDLLRRPQHFGDLKLALEELREQSESGALVVPHAPAPARRARWPVWTVLAVATVAAALAGWKLMHRMAAPSAGPILTRLTSDSGLTTDPAISADGKLLAYASDRAGKGNLDIWVQQMAGGEALRLTSGPADNRQPDFSPDGTKIVFRSDRDGGGIYAVSTLGGPERLVAKLGVAPRFSPDGQYIAYQVTNSLACKIYVVPTAGGEPRQLDPSFADGHRPLWSPDGKKVLVTGRVKAEMPIDLWYWLPFDGAKAIEIAARDRVLAAGIHIEAGATGGLGAWLRPPDAEDDFILFTGKLKDSVNVWQLALDRKTGQPHGEPTRLSLGQNEQLPRSAQNDSPGRRIVFAALETNDDLYSVAMDASRGTGAGEPQRLTEDLAYDGNPYLSSDGRVLMFASGRGAAFDLWKRMFPATADAPLGFAALKPSEAALSHDGTEVAFSTEQRKVLYLGSVSGGYPRKVCDDCGIPQDFSVDNKLILYTPGSFRTINSFDISSGAKALLLRHPKESLFGARFSPDGRWIAFYTVNPLRQVWIAPYRPGAETPAEQWVRVTAGERQETCPGWSPDGKMLYYLSNRDGFRCVWAQSVTGGKPFGPPFAVCHFHTARRKPQTSAATEVSLAVARDKIVVPLVEQTGNIWLASR